MRIISALALTALFAPVPALAQEVSFSDLPKEHFAYEAVMYLQSEGIISGYDDGTFRPEAAVNRAEALKLIVAPLITDEQLTQAKNAQTVYGDVANDAWFKPYVELGRVAGIIDGPPEKENFNGGNTVIKVEFMKMAQEAFGADPVTAFSEIKLPLSSDAANVNEWYYPYLRYAITSSMVMISGEGTLTPGKQLTRGETAVLLHRYIMYRQGRRTQALLSEAENEILIILSFLEQNDITEAEHASARALLAARGAHASRPDEGIVQGAVKITEAFRALVRGYRAGTNENLEEAIRLSGEAWNLANTARERDSELTKIAEQVQAIAKNMADSARKKVNAEPSEGQ